MSRGIRDLIRGLQQGRRAAPKSMDHKANAGGWIIKIRNLDAVVAAGPYPVCH
jgi:hypothetical protein